MNFITLGAERFWFLLRRAQPLGDFDGVDRRQAQHETADQDGGRMGRDKKSGARRGAMRGLTAKTAAVEEGHTQDAGRTCALRAGPRIRDVATYAPRRLRRHG